MRKIPFNNLMFVLLILEGTSCGGDGDAGIPEDLRLAFDGNGDVSSEVDLGDGPLVDASDVSDLAEPDPPVDTGPSTAPPYIAGLAPYDVLNLEGDYTPTNGVERIEDLPVERGWWDGSFEGKNHLPAITDAWSGGCGDPARRRLYINGGGHGDSAFNGIIQYDFSGTDAPTGMSVVPDSLSALEDVPPLREGGDPYDDGRAASYHTYDGVVCYPNEHLLFRVGGSPWSGGGVLSERAWAFNFDTGSWESRAPATGAGFGTPSTVINPAFGRVFHFSHTGNAAIYDIASNTWGERQQVSWSGGYHQTAVLDPARNQILIVKDFSLLRVHSIDWSARTFETSDFQVIGDTEALNDEAAGLVYDPTRDSVWVFGGRGQSRATIWEITDLGNADHEFTVTARALSHAIDPAVRGIYRRFVFFDDWRAIGLYGSFDLPAQIIRLP